VGARIAVVLALAACYRESPTVAPPPPPPRPPATLDPSPVTAPFTIKAAQLGEPDILGRIKHRTRLAKFGHAYWRLGTAPIEKFVSGQEEWRFDRTYPVLDRTETHIQIVLEDLVSRYALWVEAIDTHETLLARVRLQPSSRLAYETTPAGAWLDAGAPVTVGQSARRRRIKLRDERVYAGGFVDERLVGNVWVETHAATALDIDGLGDPPFKRPAEETAVIVPEKTRIHVAPDAGSAVIAKKHSRATRIGRKQEWTEVEIPRPFAAIRGHARILEDLENEGRVVVTDSRSGFVSYGARFPIELTAGACLYDAVDGTPIGVQLETGRRMALRTAKPEWLDIYFQTPWADHSVFVRMSNADPTQPAPCNR
jgi:hypothetical protein